MAPTSQGSSIPKHQLSLKNLLSTNSEYLSTYHKIPEGRTQLTKAE
jgi:hypothetical protein